MENFKQMQKSYQNLLDFWSSDQVKEVKKSLFKTYVKTKIKAKRFWKDDLQIQRNNIQAMFFVQKAVVQGASKKLPFTTLELLGRKLSHPAYKQDISKIIKDNVIKCNENYYKLDDLENQNKIQKALRKFQFEECSEIQKDAA